MPTEFSTFYVVLAALPILTVLVLMVFWKLSAAVAGSVGLGISVMLAVAVFAPRLGTDLDVWTMLFGAGLEALFTAATILWIIFGALCLFHLQKRTGGLDKLRDAIASISGNTRIAAILIAWFFSLFAEGAAGFGTAVALAAPFLVGFGFRPVQAVVITLIGHSVGVSFGAVGTPVVAQAQLVDFTEIELGLSAASFHVLLGWIMLAAMLRFVAPSDEDDDLRGPVWMWAAVAAFSYLVPMYLIARWVGPELPSLGGSIVGSLVFVGLFLFAHRKSPSATQSVAPGDLLRAAAPYLVVIALVLATRLIGPLKTSLETLTWSWSLWGHFKGQFNPLLHPGTLLIAGFLLGAYAARASASDVRGAARDALGKLVPVTLALVAMLGLSRVMVHATMIDVLAASTAALAGAGWPFFSPWVGVLGTFVTGSATASNILFSEFQLATTEELDMPALTLLGAQNFGAAVGNIICPHNIVAGGATVGIAGEEGEILAKTLGACVLYATLGGVLAMVFVYG